VSRPEVLTLARRARWVAYAFVPSTLLLGVTSYITTDVAPIPLLWVVPLALYLLTFILVFARRPPIPHAWMVRALPFGVSATAMMLVVQASTPMALILLVHLATFFVAAMVCHGELARDRPTATHLTEFYLWVSIGGVIGGVANGLVAPWVFRGLVEYPAALVLAAACRRDPAGRATPTWADVAFGAFILALTAGLVALGNAFKLDPAGHYFALLFAFPLFATYSQLERPARYALGIAAIFAGGVGYDASIGQTLHAERSFFGVVRVTRDASGRFVQLAHGNTIHGRQRVDRASDQPTSYYTRLGPVGQLFDELHARVRDTESASVGVVGLGAGAMAPYARPLERWTYYELDPSVVRIAENPAYFTFLRDAFHGSSRLQVVVGDARLRLADAPDQGYQLLVIDAFSSDAIPVHLLTREALALYEHKLAPHGVLAIHVSNRYLDLLPVLSNLAADAGLDGYVRLDHEASREAADLGWTPSDWVVLVRHGDAASVLATDSRWRNLDAGRGAPWTDDFSDLVRAFRF
jgi:hypothetical protein